MITKHSEKSSISIVTVTYNSSTVIEKYLQSLAKDKEIIRELILVENNSPDKEITKQKIEKYQKKGQLNIKYISMKENLGFAKSCNYGSKSATADFILFLNPDTEIKNNSLKTLYSDAIKLNADLIGGKCVKKNGERHNTIVHKPTLNIGLFEFSNLGKLFNYSGGHRCFYYLDNNKIYNAKKDVRVDALGGAFLMANKIAFKKLHGFDERFFMYLEDVDLGVRANENNMNVIYCPHSVIFHVGGASSKNKYKIMHQAWYDSRKVYYKKHFGTIVNLIIQPIFILDEYLLKMLRPQ